MDSAKGSERQLYILSLLSQSAKGYTIKDIEDRLKKAGIDVTRKTVARDIDAISRNFFVYEEEDGGKTIYRADKYAASGMDFSVPQIIALHYLKELLSAGQPTSISNEAARMVDGILKKMPELSKSALMEIEEIIKVAPPPAFGDGDIAPEIMETVRMAINDGVSLVIGYESFSSGEASRRVFDPYVMEMRDGCLHLIGYCHLRGGVRDLRMSRILGAQPSGERFSAPEGFYERYSRMRFDKLSGGEPKDISVRFYGVGARLVLEYSSAMADTIAREGGTIVFKKKAAITPDLVQWILSYGSLAKALTPPELVDRINAEISAMGALYAGEGE